MPGLVINAQSSLLHMVSIYQVKLHTLEVTQRIVNVLNGDKRWSYSEIIYNNISTVVTVYFILFYLVYKSYLQASNYWFGFAKQTKPFHNQQQLNVGSLRLHIS